MTIGENVLSHEEAAHLLALSRRTLRMYRLTEREQQLVEVILEWSFARGLTEALIPELRYFVELTGVDKGDVSRALDRLIDRQIVQKKALGADARGRKLFAYRFRPEAAWWRDAPCRVDVERAMRVAEELDRVNELGRTVEPSGQVRLLDVADDGLEDGLTAASRDQANAEQDAAGFVPGAQKKDAADRASGAQTKVPAARAGGRWPHDAAGTIRVGDPPTKPVVGETPIQPRIGETPTGSNPAHVRARDDLQNDLQIDRSNDQIVSRVAKNGKTLGFADAQKERAWQRLEGLCACPAWRPYRNWWLAKVRDLPADLMLAALSDTENYLRENKCEKQPGAVLWKRVTELAGDMRIQVPAKT